MQEVRLYKILDLHAIHLSFAGLLPIEMFLMTTYCYKYKEWTRIIKTSYYKGELN